MVQLDTPTAASADGPGTHASRVEPAGRSGHGAREILVALVATAAVLATVWGAGRIVETDPAPTTVTASGTGDAASGGGAVAAPPVDDKGLALLENGHQHDRAAPVALAPTDQARLDRQLGLSRTVAAKYPTLGDAYDAGYRRAGPFVPGLGTHMVLMNGSGLNPDGTVDDTDILNPQTIIYDGNEPEAPVAGFMYYTTSEQEPAGWVGPNDHWHYHTNVCLRRGAAGIEAPLGADAEVSEAQCKEVGGFLLDQTGWMVHVWTVAGYESDRGVFSEINPALDCSDGTYYKMPDAELTKHLENLCVADAA